VDSGAKSLGQNIDETRGALVYWFLSARSPLWLNDMLIGVLGTQVDEVCAFWIFGDHRQEVRVRLNGLPAEDFESW
jgi:hypothetical protein